MERTVNPESLMHRIDATDISVAARHVADTLHHHVASHHTATEAGEQTSQHGGLQEIMLGQCVYEVHVDAAMFQ